MSKTLKTLLLATCAGVCFVVFAVMAGFLNARARPSLHQYLSEFQGWQGVTTLFDYFLLGVIPCLIFGTPFLLLIEKYFSRFDTRYTTGGFVAGWVAWFFMVGPLLTPSPWLDAEIWLLDGFNYVGLYVGLGFCTGLLFTALLWILEKLNRKRLRIGMTAA